MALRTFCSQTLLMNILRRVARGAGKVGLLEGVIRMAGFAGRDRMQAQEREAREFVVESNAAREALGIVAFATVFPEVAPMDIVSLMATVAGRIAVFFFGHTTGMTGVTRRLRMSTEQRKLRLLSMIEGSFLPTRRRVAGLAFLAEAFGVDIVTRMTA